MHRPGACLQANEAGRRYTEEASSSGGGSSGQATFEAKDLESISGRFHTVCCIDVLIHYPPVRAGTSRGIDWVVHSTH